MDLHIETIIADIIKIANYPTHSVIPRLIIKLFPNVNVCTSIKDHTWYTFKGHYWTKCDDKLEWSEYIKNDLCKYFINARNYLEKLTNVFGTIDDFKKVLYPQLTSVQKAIELLNGYSFWHKVIREYAVLTYRPNFVDNLDSNPALICFTNGIYDADQNVFRNGRPEDYVSRCVGYEYVPFDKKNPIARDIKKFLSELQPNKGMRQYLMRALSNCLNPNNKENICVFYGTGSNGKTTLTNLLYHTLAILCKKMDPALLNNLEFGKNNRASTNNKSSNASKASKASKAWIFDDVSGTNFNLRETIRKIATLYYEKPPMDYDSKVNLFILTNLPPRADDEDSRTYLKIIPFPERFDKCIDYTERIKSWAPTFMGLLIKYYAKYKN